MRERQNHRRAALVGDFSVAFTRDHLDLGNSGHLGPLLIRDLGDPELSGDGVVSPFPPTNEPLFISKVTWDFMGRDGTHFCFPLGRGRGGGSFLLGFLVTAFQYPHHSPLSLVLASFSHSQRGPRWKFVNSPIIFRELGLQSPFFIADLNRLWDFVFEMISGLPLLHFSHFTEPVFTGFLNAHRD